ncbi:hypothetical protein PF002_g3400 [Phytophthora fragariae]|uniref:C3H1-type domain-containing protein n=1 Tax=Phytophthora fragariae TaxID=53985 RepID=A0A6A3ULM4_9STRA|nr:hypothetical protein PF009_g3174 [Phytophthora fragariae]KAE9127187.1 hypothetical protein PF007_g5691 [Phytophthora fragariae]KAE9151076.1 hypothetical protein PF006_g4611 [Phytophthora fragariae]KAE9246714.1 hypothetical protein PF004_g4659 [Phytophthora fragariae]KAE9253287.1 hypothetical protein PF002_g3400 [Phytophthora fragariae]
MKAPATQRAQPLKQDWRISFGFWTELDALYHAYPPPSKPRCPALPHDSASEWRKRLIPDDIERFLSNPAAAACLRTVSSNIDDDAATGFTNFIISGGSCTGKSTFAGILRKTLVGLTADLPCRFATLNASGIAEKSLPSKLEDTVKRLDASKAGAPSYLTIEHFESVSPSVQQHFFVPLLAEANSKRVFVILLVRPDANKLAEQIKAQAMKIYLHALSANFVRIKLLLVCQQESIGYTREGLEELTKLFSFKLMPCLEKLHEIFVKQYFISQANVFKMIQSASDSTGTADPPGLSPFPLSILRMNEHLRRCPKCTLLPPCSHIPLEKLYSKIEQVRASYPQNGSKRDAERVEIVLVSNSDGPGNEALDATAAATPERVICPSFGRRGVCTNVQKLGRCRYAHPLDLHTIDTTALVPRCRSHTLPLPCLHCSNVEQHKLHARKEIAACDQLRREILRCRQALADLETQRYLFARDRGKAAEWGGAKKAADEQMARMDAGLNSAHDNINRLEQELSSRQEALEKLQDAIVHGSSKGLGKGHGRIEGKPEDKQL